MADHSSKSIEHRVVVTLATPLSLPQIEEAWQENKRNQVAKFYLEDLSTVSWPSSSHPDPFPWPRRPPRGARGALPVCACERE